MEMKFRGRSITGELVYGNFIHSKRFKGMSNEFRIHDQDTGTESDVWEDTVGMYIGIKDINGVEIYTSDVVIRKESDCAGEIHLSKHLVIYDKDELRFCLECISSPIFIKGAKTGIYDYIKMEVVKLENIN